MNKFTKKQIEDDKKFFWDRIKKLNSQILFFQKENDLILKAYSI